MSKLPERDRPLLVGKDLDGQVKSFLPDLRSSGGMVSSAIPIAAAKDIVLAKDANLLAENGGSINLTNDWWSGCSTEWDLLNREQQQSSK